MKCKKGYKLNDGKCVKTKKTKILKKIDMKPLISLFIFAIFSFVLFINNTTDLFDKFGVSYNMNIIAWLGLVGVVFYLIYLAWVRGRII